jgi:hypothetical protein
VKVVTVSCHVERPLDDRCWRVFNELQALRPHGFEVAALMRPPEPDESETLWLARARIAAARAPFGHHTHWGGAAQARPVGGDPAERVRREAAWLREHGLQPQFFSGGGWYMDESLASALVELGYTDCTSTAFRPDYLPPGAPSLELAEPMWLRVAGGRLLELPATHSLGMAARAALRRRLPRFVHIYFHDTDLVDPRRLRALLIALAAIARRRRPVRLDALTAESETDFVRQLRE